MKCKECGFKNPKDAQICLDCGGELETQSESRSSKASRVSHLDAEINVKETTLRTTHYEQRRYNLEPKKLNESDETFVERINSEKTESVIHELDMKRKANGE